MVKFAWLHQTTSVAATTTLLVQQWEVSDPNECFARVLWIHVIKVYGIGCWTEFQFIGTVTKDLLVSNELVMTPTLQHLGPRPSGNTRMVHIKSLDMRMNIEVCGCASSPRLTCMCVWYVLSLPSLRGLDCESGSVTILYTQRWTLRRMIRLFNGVVRRGHAPTESASR